MQNDGRWLAMGWRVSRGELAGRWHAESRRMRHRGQRMARSEMADAVPCDGGWLAGGRQMLCRVLHGLWCVGGWCAEGRRMVRRKQAGGAWKAGELPTEGVRGATFSPLEL